MVLADTISVLQYLFTFLILAMAFAYVTPKLVLAYRLIALTCQGIRRKTKFPSITREKQGTWPEPQSREELFRTLCSLSSSSCSISTMQEDLSTTSTENSSSDSSNRTATMIQTGTTRTYDTNNHKKKDTTKVIWGYWHQGINNLPGFCQMAVESWRLHHPDWNVIILSQENYKDFVSPKDLPSTFKSLKIQFQSDIIRASVLKRYGGVYLDISYVLLKALDDIWENAKEKNDIYLTSLWTLELDGHDFVVPNICLIISPQPNNPLLAAWHNALLNFFERPCFTITEMKQHPVLMRVGKFIDHPSLWQIKKMSPYFASLWVLMDTLYFNEKIRGYVSKNVWMLPTLLWTVDQLMIDIFSLSEDEVYEKAHRHESCWVWMKRIPNAMKWNFGDDEKAASKFSSLVSAVKASTDFSPNFNMPPEFHLQHKSTQGRIWRKAMNKTAPRQQATAKGAYPVVVPSTLPSSEVNSSFSTHGKNDVPEIVFSIKEAADLNVELDHTSLCDDSSLSKSHVVEYDVETGYV